MVYCGTVLHALRGLRRLQYKELAPHYGIKESMGMLKCCLPLLSFYQLINEIMVKEGLHMVMAGVAPDDVPPEAAPEAAPAPEPEGMERQME